MGKFGNKVYKFYSNCLSTPELHRRENGKWPKKRTLEGALFVVLLSKIQPNFGLQKILQMSSIGCSGVKFTGKFWRKSVNKVLTLVVS